MAVPDKVKLHRRSGELELAYGRERLSLSAEYLRVHSPSAERRGHGAGQPRLESGKQGVGISSLEAAGNYALRIVFDDGHDSGIYSWDFLYDLATNAERYWREYLEALERAGKSRDPAVQPVRLMDPSE